MATPVETAADRAARLALRCGELARENKELRDKLADLLRCSLCGGEMAAHTIVTEERTIEGIKAVFATGWACPAQWAPGQTWVCDDCMREVDRSAIHDMADGEHVLCIRCHFNPGWHAA